MDPSPLVESLITSVVSIGGVLGALGGYQWHRSRNGNSPATRDDVSRLCAHLEKHIEWSTIETAKIHDRITDVATATARAEGLATGRHER